MILQHLKDYYDRKAADPESGIAPEGFEHKEIPFILVLDPNGGLVQVKCTRQPIGKQLRAKAYLVPQAEKRTRGIKANLLWDNAEYLLGLANHDADSDVPKKHDAFIQRIKNVGLENDEGIAAVLKFLANDPIGQLNGDESFEEIKENNPFMSFELVNDQGLVSQRIAVIQKIQSLDSKHQTQGICLVTGEKDALAKLQPSIKGVRGANSTGGNIVSFNLSPFNSYRKIQGANAPIGEIATFAYTTALNHLLGKDSQQKLQLGQGTTIVFWSDRKTKFEEQFGTFFNEPSKDNPDALTESVRGLYESMKKGMLPDGQEKAKFFILGLSPNAARISIRFWLTGTIKEISENIMQHFQDIEIEHAPHERDYLSIWRMLLATAAQGKTDNILPAIEGDWLRSILAGKRVPYPDSLFQAVMRRIHAEKDVTYQRAAIIKGYLNRKQRFHNQPEEVTVSLDKDNKNVGYRLGRLFATLEKIQEEAHNRNLNVTIRDRYYSSASSTPNSVFPILMRSKNHHIGKIENKGRAINFERLLGEIMSDVDVFPSQLNLSNQGLFAIGYYHQRQDFFKRNDSTTNEQGE